MNDSPFIVLTADASHAQGAAVTIRSLTRSNPDLRPQFRLLHDGLDRLHLDYFEAMAASLTPGSSLECIDVAKELPKRIPTQRHYSRTAYARYLAPEILADTARFLYLDSDMLCETSLTRLFSGDYLQNCGKAFAAVTLGRAEHFLFYIPDDLRQQAAIRNDTRVFSTGFMLFNTAVWNNAGMTSELLDFSIRNHHKLPAIDQDAMNLLFAERNEPLESHYNIATPLDDQKVSHTPLRPGVYHLCDGLKPWQVRPSRNTLRADGLWHYHARAIPNFPRVVAYPRSLPRFNIISWLKFVRWSAKNKGLHAGHLAKLLMRLCKHDALN